MVKVLLTRITQLNIVKPVNPLSMKPNIIKPLVSFISSSDLQIDLKLQPYWLATYRKSKNCLTCLQHRHQTYRTPLPTLCFAFPTSTTTVKSLGARHKADSKLQILSQKKTTRGLFSSDVNIDPKTKPQRAKEMSPLAGSNRGPQDND
jgi:hypothetical protein